MARGRMIDKVVILSKKINKVSEGAENLYYRIYVNTDDFGLFHADSEILKGQIYTLRRISIPTIEKRLAELANIGLIKTYKNNDERYLEITNFEKHQTFRKDYVRKYEYPKPDTKSYESVRNRTKSHSKLNKDKLSEDKLKEDTPLHKEIITYLNEKTKKNFSLSAEKTIEFINGRLGEGFKLDDFKHVINVKVADWGDDVKMNKFLRPSTLFSKSNFENYRNETLPKRRPKVGENTHETTKREIEYNEARLKKLLEIDQELAGEVKKATKAKDIERLDELENIRKEKIAEFSQEYSAREEL